MDSTQLLIYCFSYNKREEEFTTLRDYNDYLEEVEIISEFLIEFFCMKVRRKNKCRRDQVCLSISKLDEFKIYGKDSS